MSKKPMNLVFAAPLGLLLIGASVWWYNDGRVPAGRYNHATIGEEPIQFFLFLTIYMVVGVVMIATGVGAARKR